MELLFEGVECDEVVAFNDEVFANDAILVTLYVRYTLFTINGVAVSSW